MTYEEAMEKVNHRLRFGIKPGLERVSALLVKLGNPQKQLKFVHVAGTNGKGTTCTLIAGALKAAGYRTGLYNPGRKIIFRLEPQQGDLFGMDAYVPSFRSPRCRECGMRVICNGCSECGRCAIP